MSENTTPEITPESRLLQPRLVRIPEEFALRAINALSYRYNKVMDDPNTHGKDGVAKLLMEGADSDKRAMAVISSAISDANVNVEARDQ